MSGTQKGKARRHFGSEVYESLEVFFADRVRPDHDEYSRE
jgi:hypothetical protein